AAAGDLALPQGPDRPGGPGDPGEVRARAGPGRCPVRRGRFDERPALRRRIAELEAELAVLRERAAALRPYDRDEAHPAPGEPRQPLPAGVDGYPLGGAR